MTRGEAREVNPRDIVHLVVLAHPAEQSFNRSVAEEYCDAVSDCGQTAVIRDLYALDFDPRLRANERPGTADFRISDAIEQELALLRSCAVVTLVYPLWFGMPPAMIKGYIDRVLGSGFAVQDIKTGKPNFLLGGKRLLILSSSGSTRPWLEEHGQWVALHQAFETYLTTIFGLASADHLHFDAIVPGCGTDYINDNLYDTRMKAREMCAAELSQRHAAQMRVLTGHAA